ncbi:hypothetical protein MPTK1_1g03460 [Marchantia polymorpha subsp. ruderalis]|uniref:Uncharacterized protein n=2 Tax=Marchantia polymorpha TaxID=3197 RepID=A0AAF6AL41_MARPO|nr:hypothetical protein MARPO_0005s0261 [Marchantia polymorpha]BBM97161.1 hypothetical protein Mp_1g03460 [Marchantia polymorpha subsp. ruderalis]|eukprot:PTQ48644.1 hypothetical protein MARPO_0005s0261 [Marchantia polymorpha]
MEVKRESKRLIKTNVADGSKEVALSPSDLVVPRVHVEIIYAFEAPVPSDASQMLEDALATTLLDYEEWAGRMSKDSDGRPVIALNGQGAAWIDAEANVPLRDLMPFPPGYQLLELVPPNRGAEELLLVQVTKFSCGGITLGIARHHQVADGESSSQFMDAWTWAVKKKGAVSDEKLPPPPPSPLHDRSLLMASDPPQPTFEHAEYKKPAPPNPEQQQQQQAEHPPLAIKKLHFGPELLKKIKSEAMKDLQDGAWFTTFESLTAHLWRCITRARGLAGGTDTRALVATNGRPRLKTRKLPANYFGNVIFHACSQASVDDLTGRPLSYAAGLVQTAIRRVDEEYILSALDFTALQLQHPVPVARGHRTVLSPNLSVTSWAGLPLYKTDFGWGTPLFVGPPLIPFEGLLMLLPSYTQDGAIDASVGLFAPDMERLESFAFQV